MKESAIAMYWVMRVLLQTLVIMCLCYTGKATGLITSQGGFAIIMFAVALVPYVLDAIVLSRRENSTGPSREDAPGG